MPPLSSAARSWLLGLARQAVEAAGRRSRPPSVDPPGNLSLADRSELERPRAVFVTLLCDGRLRGCVGHTAFDTPLARVVVKTAEAAARCDSRFSPIAPEELPDLEVEISILSPFEPVEPGKIQVGTHGLMVHRGGSRGLLLPQVAWGRNWSPERFLEETCRKAGLPADAWRHGATVEAFTAEVIGEREQ